MTEYTWATLVIDGVDYGLSKFSYTRERGEPSPRRGPETVELHCALNKVDGKRLFDFFAMLDLGPGQRRKSARPWYKNRAHRRLLALTPGRKPRTPWTRR